MPYYWYNVKNAYAGAPDCWQKHDMAIVSDLAWFLIGRDDTPEEFCSFVDNANEGQEDWREPRSSEHCLFKTWYDQILVSETSWGYRDSLLRTLLKGEFENLTENQASFVIHLLPCEVIRSFIQHTKQQIMCDLEQLTQHFGEPQDLNIDYYSSSDESYVDGLDDEDYDSMPELQDVNDSSDQESEEESDEESNEESDEESDDETDYETDVDSDKEDVEYENDIEDARNEFLQGALTAQEFNEYITIRTDSRDRTASRPAYIRV